jgi:hypothetical protein
VTDDNGQRGRARAAGMHAIHHRDLEGFREELARLIEPEA